MKKVIAFIMLSVCVQLQSCEDVVDVNLPETEERLVIDGLVRVSGQNDVELILIKLSKTAPFFDQEVPIIEDAEVELRTSEKTYKLNYGAGFYSTNITRKALLNQTFELHINYDKEEYTGNAQFVPTVPIDSLTQGSGSLFSGNEKEVIISYTDPADTDDYYLFDLDYGFFIVSEDTFYQGKPFSFSYFYDDLEPEDEVRIHILGVDREFYDYMNIVITQTGQDSGGPFESPPAEVRGNMRNITNPDHYPLGYFEIAQEYSQSIEIE